MRAIVLILVLGLALHGAGQDVNQLNEAGERNGKWNFGDVVTISYAYPIFDSLGKILPTEADQKN